MIKISEKKLVARVTHYFRKIEVAALKLEAPLRKGDKIRIIRKNGTGFTQEVQSMELKNKQITEAQAGQEIAIKVNEVAREDCCVYKIEI